MMIIRLKNKNWGAEDAVQLADCVACIELWVPSRSLGQVHKTGWDHGSL